jgi:hypothetical protein
MNGMVRSKRALFALVVAFGPSAAIAACGARTPLIVPEYVDAMEIDVRKDVRKDATPDVPIPRIDAMPLDAYRNDCPDADSTLVYLVTEQNELLSFFPPDASFKKIGNLACPATTMGATPFSMGVDRKGIAQVLYNDGELFRVSTANASCQATPFKANTTFTNFGMAYATIGAGPMEELFIMANDGTLGKVDFVTNTPQLIGYTAPTLSNAELTGTGDGRLYAFYADDNGLDGIAEVNKTNAKVIGSDPLPNVNMTNGSGGGGGWAFAFWGGDFYLFTGDTASTVTRYRLSDKSIKVIASYSGLIVGAGVSTCAPSQ